MTDENETGSDGTELDDVDAALEASGFVESDAESDGDDAESEQSRVGGLLGKLGEMSGSGKSLDAYENDPIAGIWAKDDGEIPRGAKHIARGVDGLSPFAAAHPFVDIAVGVVLLKADDETGGGLFDGKDKTDGPDDDGDDGHYRGDMLT